MRIYGAWRSSRSFVKCTAPAAWSSRAAARGSSRCRRTAGHLAHRKEKRITRPDDPLVEFYVITRSGIWRISFVGEPVATSPGYALMMIVIIVVIVIAIVLQLDEDARPMTDLGMDVAVGIEMRLDRRREVGGDQRLAVLRDHAGDRRDGVD